MIYSLDEFLPLYSIFILILIISAGFLTELFPCKLQRVLKENIYLKHFFCFLTMIFFVVLTTPLKDQNVLVIIKKSIALYIIFLFFIKTNFNFFIVIMILTGILYLSMLKKYELISESSSEKDPNKKKVIEGHIDTIIYINNCIFIIIIILIIIGFVLYLGEKKYEYKNDFNYTTFLLGKSECRNKSPEISMFKALEYSIK